MKNFLDWHKVKKKLEEKGNRIHFQIRDIFFCSIGENVGWTWRRIFTSSCCFEKI